MDNNIGKIGIGSYNWNVGSTPPRKDISAPSEGPTPMLIPSDAVSLSGSHAPATPEAPPAPAAAPRPRESVPVSLLAEDFAATSLGGGHGATHSNPVAHLGVMAQFDEAGPVHSVRRIDGPSQPGAFADLHLVGPANAARYPANPDELYLGM